MSYDVASACYKCLHLVHRHSDSCTSCSRHISNNTSAGVTRIQVAKVVIASVLILTACARVPEGKDCVLKCVSDVKFPQMSHAILKLFAV